MVTETNSTQAIRCVNKRLVKQGKNGVTQYYRIVVRNAKTRQILSQTGIENRVAAAVLQMINDAKLNDHNTDLSLLRFKGRKIHYKGNVYESKQESYQNLVNLFKNTKTNKNQKLPVTTNLQNTEATHPPDPTVGRKIEGKYHKHNKEASSHREIKSQVDDLPAMLNLLKEMHAQNGKLRLKKDLVVFSPSEIGPNGRKGGQTSVDVINYILQKLQPYPRMPPDNIKQTLEILKVLYQSSWGSTCMRNNRNLDQIAKSIIKTLYELSASDIDEYGQQDLLIADKYITFDGLINEALYDDVYDLQALTEAILDESRKGNRSLPETLAKLFAKPGLLSALRYNKMAYANLVNVLDILKQAGTNVSELEEIMSKNQPIQVNPPQPIPNALFWINLSQAIKDTTIKQPQYSLFVDEVANDLSTLYTYWLKTGFEDTDIRSRSQKLSYFIAKEILTPSRNQPTRIQAHNMITFFMDVQNKLAQQDHLGPFMIIQAALQSTPVKRLGIPKKQEKLQKTLNAYAANGHKKMMASNQLSDEQKRRFIPDWFSIEHENRVLKAQFGIRKSVYYEIIDDANKRIKRNNFECEVIQKTIEARVGIKNKIIDHLKKYQPGLSEEGYEKLFLKTRWTKQYSTGVVNFLKETILPLLEKKAKEIPECFPELNIDLITKASETMNRKSCLEAVKKLKAIREKIPLDQIKDNDIEDAYFKEVFIKSPFNNYVNFLDGCSVNEMELQAARKALKQTSDPAEKERLQLVIAKLRTNAKTPLQCKTKNPYDLEELAVRSQYDHLLSQAQVNLKYTGELRTTLIQAMDQVDSSDEEKLFLLSFLFAPNKP